MKCNFHSIPTCKATPVIRPKKPTFHARQNRSKAIALSIYLFLFFSITLRGQEQEPVVARTEMHLIAGEETLDVIEPGDLLTVLEDRGEKYLIQTHNGKKGVVAKVNAVKLAESTDIYTSLIEKSKDPGRLHTLRASAWWALGEREKALADFDKAIQLGYREAHAFSSRGLFYAATSDFEKAVADFTTAIENGGNDSVAYINRAAAYMSLGKYEEAITDYGKILESAPDSGAIYQQRAIAKKLIGKLDESIADFDKSIEINKENIPAFMGRGFVYFQKAQYEAAIQDFTRVIELNPKAAVAYNNRGYNLQQLGKVEEAAADYSKAIELAPNYELAYQNQAWFLATCENEKIKDPKRAVEAASKACELSDFKNPSNVAALAAALAADGQFEKAVGWQEKVVEAAEESQKEFANRMLDRYKTGLPFDPKIAAKIGDTK
jgi:tetratricopeptide (TPR) repeat protein